MAGKSVNDYPSLDSFHFGDIVPGAREPPRKILAVCGATAWRGVVDNESVCLETDNGPARLYFAWSKELKNNPDRLYFLCPCCGENVRKVYFFRGAFCCRRCAGLSYPSQQVSKSELPRLRMVKLFKKLDPEGDYTFANVVTKELPPCPEGMSFGEYCRITLEILRNHEAYFEWFRRMVRKYL